MIDSNDTASAAEALIGDLMFVRPTPKEPGGPTRKE
jgi:hypothetical protein